MKIILTYVFAAVMVCGCGVADMIKRNDDRYLQPSALDSPIGPVLDSYKFKFLNEYNVTYQWPANAKHCKMGSVATLNTDWGLKSEFFYVPDIFEKDGKTWQASTAGKFYDFDKYVRSVKVMNPIFGDVNGVHQKIGEEELENGLGSMCFDSWALTSHTLMVFLYKWDLKTWKALNTQHNPKGKWTEQQVGNNLWTVQEVPEQELASARLNATGGWFQNWLLPIGNTGYTLSLILGASKESLQKPDAHARMKEMFRQMIEAVKIEPIQP